MSVFLYKVRNFISPRKNSIIRKLMGIIMKYVVVSVTAKVSLKFKSSTREMPKNRSKFTKKYKFLLFLVFCPLKLYRCLALVRFVMMCDLKCYRSSRSGHANFFADGSKSVTFFIWSILKLYKGITKSPHIIGSTTKF